MNINIMDIGNILMAILAIFSMISAIILTVQNLKSQERKDIKTIKNIKNNLTDLSYLRNNSEYLKPRMFLYSHKNTGDSPCDLDELIVDESYNYDNSMFVSKGDY